MCFVSDGRESRVLAWEAKEKKSKAQAKGVEEKKPVDLEKEWARTAAAKQVKFYITFSNGSIPLNARITLPNTTPFTLKYRMNGAASFA